MSYKKVGGIHFVKIGRFGFNFYISKARAKRVEYVENEELRIERNLTNLRRSIVGDSRQFT